MKVGFGKVEITPPLGTPCALGVDDELVEVWDDIWVRALCFIGDDERPVFILSADVIGFTWEDRADLVASLSNRLGRRDFELVFHTVHQHQTPNVRWHICGELREHGLNAISREYYDFFVRAAAEAAERAHENAGFCTGLSFGEAPVSGIQSNRRLLGDDGQVTMRYSRPPAELREFPEGHIDPLVRVALLRREGSSDVCWANYHGHPTSTGGDEGPWCTGDFPGQALRFLEAEMLDYDFIYGTAPHGNLNPGKYVTGGRDDTEAKLRDRDRMGRTLAGGVKAALEHTAPMAMAQPGFARRCLLVPLKDDFVSAEEAEVKFRQGVEEALAAHAKSEKVTSGGSVRGAVGRRYVHHHLVEGKLPVYVSVLSLGEVAVVFLPGEIFLEASEQIRSARPGRSLLTFSLCDSWCGYIPTPEVYQQGGYELSASHVSPDALGQCVGAAVRLLGQT